MKPCLTLAASLLLLSPLSAFAFAQQEGPAGPPPAQGQPAHQRHDGRQDGRGQQHPGPGGEMGGPEHLLPGGMWWKNPQTVTAIALTPDQVKHIDEIFLQSRVQLIHMHATLEEQEVLLEPLLHANPVDQPKALAQISKIADTRADLEKANAKMLLSIRAVLSADQWTKLEAQHGGGGRPGGPGPARGPNGERGPGGQRGPGGPSAQQGPPPAAE